MKRPHFDRRRTVWFFALLGLFAVFSHPSWLPFLPDGLRTAWSTAVHSAFGQAGALRWQELLSRLAALAAAMSLLAALYLAARAVFSRMHRKTRRGRTAVSLELSLLQYAAVIAGLFWGLSILGVNTAAMLASVGVLGLVLGLGAQSLIADVLAGVSLIFEDHYAVGDVVKLDGFRGRVVSTGVRTTVLEDAYGNRKIINNSDLRNFENRAQRLSRVTCDIGISYEQPIPPVETLITDALPGIQAQYGTLFPVPIVYEGVERLDGSAVVLRVLAHTDEMDTPEAARVLNRALKLLFDENGISIPFAQLVVHSDAPDTAVSAPERQACPERRA